MTNDKLKKIAAQVDLIIQVIFLTLLLFYFVHTLLDGLFGSVFSLAASQLMLIGWPVLSILMDLILSYLGQKYRLNTLMTIIMAIMLIPLIMQSLFLSSAGLFLIYWMLIAIFASMIIFYEIRKFNWNMRILLD